MNASADDAGFSVLELMIALSIVSVLIVLLTSAFLFGQRVNQTVSRGTREIEDAIVLKRLLADTLGQVVRSDSMAAQPVLLGNEDGLRVVSLGPRLLSAAGPVWIDVASRQDGGGLVAAWGGLTDGAGLDERRQVLPADRHLRFSYFGAGRWTANWRRVDAVPAMVRAEIQYEGEARHGPAIIIPVRSIVPFSCAVDRTSRCGGRP